MSGKAEIRGRIAWLVVTGLAHEMLLWLPLAVLGFVLVPLAYALRRTIVSPITGKKIETSAGLLWLWGNDEDGFLPQWYADAHPKWGKLRRAYMWAAIRNPVDNLKYVPGINPPLLVPGEVHMHVAPGYTLMWWGPFTHVFIHMKGHKWYRFGWKMLSYGFGNRAGGG